MEKNKQAFHALIHAKNNNAVAALHTLLAPDFKAHFTDFHEPVNREQYIQLVQLSHQSFSNLVIHVEDLIAEEDKIVGKLHTTGMHTGSYHGFDASQNLIAFDGMTICRFVNGTLVEEWQVSDILSLLKQMGLSVNHII
jgi:predicted ester cyclase